MPRINKQTKLAPDIVQDVLNGEVRTGQSLAWARLVKVFPVDQRAQRKVFGFGG